MSRCISQAANLKFLNYGSLLVRKTQNDRAEANELENETANLQSIENLSGVIKAKLLDLK